MPDHGLVTTEIVDVLQELAKTARDGEEGYRHAAELTKDRQLAAAFEELARVRGDHADQLDQAIVRLGGQPEVRKGSISGTLHRMFVDLRAALSRDDRHAVLDEVVRGEALAEAIYDKAMRIKWPDDLRRLVDELHDGVRASRDKFRTMQRDLGTTPTVTGKRSFATVTEYVAAKPITSAAIVLGATFLLGVAIAASTRRRPVVPVLPAVWRRFK